jgi:hypothetical protein
MVYPDDHFMRWIIKIALFAVCFYGVAKFCKKQTGSFTLSRISSQLKPEPRWDTLPLPPGELADLRQILNQPYTYLNKGAQSFVFASQDGNYVIKFFRHHHMSAPLWLRWNQKTVTKRHGKLYKDFDSYKLAFDNLREETGLLYLHLNKTSHLNKTLTITDKFDRTHDLNLDQVDFIIQRKADLVHDKINAQVAQGDLEGAKKTISSLINLIVLRCKKGYCDDDPNIATNCGIYQDHAIKIDVGRFYVDPKMKKPLFYKPELYHITRPFRVWLLKNHPKLAEHLDHEILQVIIHD